MINNFNKILSSDNLELIDKFSYFIAGLKLALNVYGSNKISFFFTSYDAFYRENGEKLYKRISLKYEDIQRFQANEGKIQYLIDINEIPLYTAGNNNKRVDTNFINQSMQDLQHYYFYTFDE